MSKAKQVEITMIKMEEMYNSTIIAREDYLKNMEALSPKQRLKSISIFVPPPEKTLDDFIDLTLKNLATVSHGDIVLTNCGVEVKRAEANYIDREVFNNPDGKSANEKK